MYELSVALQYLVPRWRQLSVSIISVISVIVIALVVWLIVVFFSVTSGLEKSWVQKLVAVTAPARLTPTDEYYKSYYYQIDSISSQADYNLKSISEKLASEISDPYDPTFDQEIPTQWPAADRNANGNLKDLVKEAFASIESLKMIQNITAHPYELSAANLTLDMLRPAPTNPTAPKRAASERIHSRMSQSVYLGTLDSANPSLPHVLITPSIDDINNVLSNIDVKEVLNNSSLRSYPSDKQRERLIEFFNKINVQTLMTPYEGWKVPKYFSFAQGSYACCVVRDLGIYLPATEAENSTLCKAFARLGKQCQEAQLHISGNDKKLVFPNGTQTEIKDTKFFLAGRIPLKAKIDTASLQSVHRRQDVLFDIEGQIQDHLIHGTVPLGSLVISQYSSTENANDPLWLDYKIAKNGKLEHAKLPKAHQGGEGILLPKAFVEKGVRVGDRGFISYQAPTTTAVQEQRIPILVAGFYDSGILPLGGKFLLADAELASTVRTSQGQESSPDTGGVNIFFSDLSQATDLKAQLTKELTKRGIAPYWTIETYQDYPYTRDFLAQLRSERNLFSLVALIVIIVACSNIVSMLIILVNDKKQEIGILRSMGASATSIAIIFGICGTAMGLLGSLLGISGALLTLNYLQPLVNFLSAMQGQELLNPIFYGDKLPTEVSSDALFFVIGVTGVISMIAGIVPALKASFMQPSTLLRTE